MDLSELVNYAESNYNIREQHKWVGFPGFSVLIDPDTGSWVALLMRQRDRYTRRMVQRCDLKCGMQTLDEIHASYLSPPFRMKGQKWIGISFGIDTDPKIVYRLFDRAMRSGDQRGYTIVLGGEPDGNDAPKPFSEDYDSIDIDIPERIRTMISMYERGDDSAENKRRNFYRQGKFMEDYEDDQEWDGDIVRYFPTYHDLNVRQLRGYFTWRTQLRKGEFRPVSSSLAYIYLYELLSGIGTDSPEDGLRKMREFEIGFIDSGIGDKAMRRNLRMWMFGHAVMHNIPPEKVLESVSPREISTDRSLSVLKNPSGYTDSEIFSALCDMGGSKLIQSPVIIKDREQGEHLFALVWRYVSSTFELNGRDIFSLCFGVRRSSGWCPLSNALFWDDDPIDDLDYVLNDCRSYVCRDGEWKEEKYPEQYFDRERFQTVIHAADRILRKELKTGRYLREKVNEAWAVPYINGALEYEKRKKREAARPKVRIDISGLDRIREDAAITRENLLTEEDIEDDTEEVTSIVTEGPVTIPDTEIALDGLDSIHLRILMMLIEGENPEEYIKDNRLMVSVVTDTINEALFDVIGDNVVESDGSTIRLVEDYTEDVMSIIGGR